MPTEWQKFQPATVCLLQWLLHSHCLSVLTYKGCTLRQYSNPQLTPDYYCALLPVLLTQSSYDFKGLQHIYMYSRSTHIPVDSSSRQLSKVKTLVKLLRLRSKLIDFELGLIDTRWECYYDNIIVF